MPFLFLICPNVSCVQMIFYCYLSRKPNPVYLLDEKVNAAAFGADN